MARRRRKGTDTATLMHSIAHRPNTIMSAIMRVPSVPAEHGGATPNASTAPTTAPRALGRALRSLLRSQREVRDDRDVGAGPHWRNPSTATFAPTVSPLTSTSARACVLGRRGKSLGPCRSFLPTNWAPFRQSVSWAWQAPVEQGQGSVIPPPGRSRARITFVPTEPDRAEQFPSPTNASRGLRTSPPCARHAVTGTRVPQRRSFPRRTRPRLRTEQRKSPM